MHVKPLGAKQAKVLAALLSSPSITDAAKLAKLSERSVFRYLKDPVFIDLYRQARSEQVRQAVCQVQRISAKAATVLEEIMIDPCAKPSSKVLACRTVLDCALRAVELEDLEARLSALERAAQEET